MNGRAGKTLAVLLAAGWGCARVMPPAGGPPDIYRANGRVQSDGSAVVAFDKSTGQVRWRTGDDLASYASPVAAKVGDRDIVYMFARGGLLAIDPARGETLAQFPWRARKLESVNASSPVAVGDEVFISETYELGSALVRFTGAAFEEVWTDRGRRRNQAMALHWNTPIEHQGFIYGSSGYHAPEAELRCVEWKTGKVMWSEPDLTRCSLLYVDGHFVCLGEDGTLRLVRAIEGREAVTLYGDYDVDGVTSTAQLATFLRDVGLEYLTLDRPGGALWRPREDHALSLLTTEEVPIWQAARARATDDGVLMTAWPFHCAVGTKPRT